MNKHPMLSVKEAAQLMGCDERWVRERLNQGQLKGEKKNIGLKEKWFVYAGEVEAALERRKGVANLSTDYLASPLPAPNAESSKTTQSHEPIVVAAWTDEDDDEIKSSDKSEERLAWLQDQRQALVEMAEEMMRPLVAQLQEKDSQLENREKALQAANYRLGYAEGQLKDQAEQIKLLPDFQARAEKAEHLRLEAEAAKARAAELEENLIQAEKSKQEEIERISKEKEQQAKAQQEELEALKARIAGLERSWWKKFLGVRD
jgi:DNA repair exonuclease SbcCD ATPase subunit